MNQPASPRLLAPEDVAGRRARPIVAQHEVAARSPSARRRPRSAAPDAATNIGGCDGSVKSPRRARRASRRTGCHTAFAPASPSSPWNTMAIAKSVVGPERHLLAPVRIEEALAIEGDEALDQVAGRRRPTWPAPSPNTPPKIRAARACASVRRVTTPRLPPPPPFSAQNRSGLVQALAMRTSPSAVTTSASSRPAAADAVALGEAAEAAALDQAGDADGACSRRPARSGRPWRRRHRPAARPRRRRPTPPAAARRLQPCADEGVVQLDAFMSRVQTRSESGAFDVPW